VASHNGGHLSRTWEIFHCFFWSWPFGAIGVAEWMTKCAFSFQNTRLFAAGSIILLIGASFQIFAHTAHWTLLAQHGFFQLIESDVITAFLPTTLLDTRGFASFLESGIGRCLIDAWIDFVALLVAVAVAFAVGWMTGGGFALVGVVLFFTMAVTIAVTLSVTVLVVISIIALLLAMASAFAIGVHSYFSASASRHRHFG